MINAYLVDMETKQDVGSSEAPSMFQVLPEIGAEIYVECPDCLSIYSVVVIKPFLRETRNVRGEAFYAIVPSVFVKKVGTMKLPERKQMEPFSMEAPVLDFGINFGDNK